MGAAIPFIQAAQAGLTVAQTYGDYTAAKSEGRYQRTAYDLNARFARLQAEDATKRGDVAAGVATREARQVEGAQRTGYAGQGVDVNSGTPGAIISETATLGADEAQTIRNNAWREAWGFKTQALQYEGAGRMATLAAKNKARSTLITGGLSLLNTAGNAATYQQNRADVAERLKDQKKGKTY